MKDCYLKARAYVDWLELQELVSSRKWNLMTLYKKLKGHNLAADEYSFDCNYKSICVTIHEGVYGCVVDRFIEIWDDSGACVGLWDINDCKDCIKDW